MRRHRPARLPLVVVLTVGAWMLVTPAASAYIDAGSTGFIFSAVVAFLMAAGVMVRSVWHRITRPFRRGDRDAVEDRTGASEGT